MLQAYYRAGYDFANVRVPDFDFPRAATSRRRTMSLSADGLIVDWTSYEAYPWPDASMTADYGVFDALAAVLPDGMKLIAYGPGGVLENVIEIVGFERLCLLLADDPDLVECVFEAVGETLVRYYEIAAGASGRRRLHRQRRLGLQDADHALPAPDAPVRLPVA